ncbi:MAG: hypothetical protein JSU61_02380 [Fidelibacterota bacterium]|nr:MAG: hypothetical protein JSU61_02380 [Candidatus Neomarinimicrobiota bacterium]
MVDRRGYRVEKLSGNRRMVAAVSAISREYDAIHLMTEVDITEPRGFIS